MTEVERQILEALKTVPLLSDGILYGDSNENNQHHRVLYSLAPRIAAAIDCASFAGWRIGSIDQGDRTADEAKSAMAAGQQRAIASLRGTPYP